MIAELLFKAGRSADAAETLLAAGHANDAASRAYYAMFNAARALVLARNASFEAKTHATVLQEFNRLFIKTGELPRGWGSMLNRAQSARHIADYHAELLSADEARLYVDHAREFVRFAVSAACPEPPQAADR